MDIIQVTRDIPNVAPDVVMTVGAFPVTNTFLMILVILSVLVTFIFSVRIFTSRRPGGFQNFIEVVYEAMFALVEQITGSKKLTAKLFPLIGSLFVFIGISNLIGMLPGLTDIQYKGVSVLRTPTSDFNTTVGLATAMVFLVQIAIIKENGVLGYFGKFFQFANLFKAFKKSLGDGFLAIIEFLVGLLDIVSELAKIISLSLRLFGNMYAGAVLAVILLGAFAYVLPSLWMGLSVLFSIVQAMVFGALVTAYFALAVPETNEQNIKRIS